MRKELHKHPKPFMTYTVSTWGFPPTWNVGNLNIKREHSHDVMLIQSATCGLPGVFPFKGNQ